MAANAALAVRFPYDPSTWDFNQAGKPYYSDGLRKRFQLDALQRPQLVVKPSVNYANISYEPNEAEYLERVKNRLKTAVLSTEVPQGWPTQLSGPLVWTTDDFQNENEFVYHLSDADKAEIVDALTHFKGNSVCTALFLAPFIAMLTLSQS